MLYCITFLLIGSVVSFSASCPNGWRQSEVIPKKCYLIVTNKKNWFDAENYCKSPIANGHLTSISSAFEQANINAILTDTQTSSVCDNMWIGTNDIELIGVFTWIDGTPFLYAHWKPVPPDLSPDKLCVAAESRSSSGYWSTNNCGDEFCFICENNYLNPSTTTSPQTTPCTGTATPYVPPSTTQGPNPEAAISSLICMLAGMEITVEYKFLNDYFPNWTNTGAGFFIDGALPACAHSAQEVFIPITSPPYTFTLNFTDCNINITKHYDNNHELVSYTALVNGRFTALKRFVDPTSPDFSYPNVTVPLYCDWNAKQGVTARVRIVPTVPPTVLPTVYGSYSHQLVMNVTTASPQVLEGDRIKVGILLVPDDAYSFVAELPMECTITNACNPDNTKLYAVYESCPNWNISQFIPSLNLTAFKKDSSDFFFEFDAFTYYEGQTSTLLIECTVQLCMYADDCKTACWPESSEITFLNDKSRLSKARQSSISPSQPALVSCFVHILPRSLTATSPSHTSNP